MLSHSFLFVVGNVYEMAPQQKRDSHAECTTVNSSGEYALTFENSLTVSSTEVRDFSVLSNKYPTLYNWNEIIR